MKRRKEEGGKRVVAWRKKKKTRVTPPTSDQHLFASQSAKSQPKEPATKTGEGPSYRFRSDVPAPPSNTALGGKASLLPKRTPVSEEEIEAIMLGGCL
ncbi:hypothetical protein FCM35_KLT00964 [Carex littledalei]|uniref:Uncharacterized protein n=1 Tax=Carex littledalei TaxID=544730 RepID=A0A833R4N5_9POAL|nr:hypothetical protein FCM35_KLT00964 [Carex littledalei]